MVNAAHLQLEVDDVSRVVVQLDSQRARSSHTYRKKGGMTEREMGRKRKERERERENLLELKGDGFGQDQRNDVSSRCDLSLAARDTVEPVIEKSQKNIGLNLICMVWMSSKRQAGSSPMNDTTESTTGADWMRPAPRVPENRLHRIGAATTRLQAALSFFSRVCFSL